VVFSTVIRQDMVTCMNVPYRRSEVKVNKLSHV